MGQDFAQLLAEAFLPEKVGPDNEAAMGSQALVGEADVDGRRRVFGVNLEPHRLVRLLEFGFQLDELTAGLSFCLNYLVM